MNYNEFFLRLLKEAAMPTYPSASETDGLAQKAVAGETGDLDAVNDSFGSPADAASEINSTRQRVRDKFESQLDSTLAMKGDIESKAKAFQELTKKIEKIERIKAPAQENNDDDILANVLYSDTDFGMKIDEAKAEMKKFNDLKTKMDELKGQLETAGEDDEQLEMPPNLPA
jgi:hypothetical protein